MIQAQRLPLTRGRIVQAALRLVDEHGLDALSMRKLGAELGVEAMSLYNHVPSKAALLDALTETLLAQVDILPEGEQQDWAERVRVGAHSLRRVALAHPCLIQLVTTRPLRSPGALAVVETALAILRGAGFELAGAVYAFRALIGYAVGAISQELNGPQRLPEQDLSHLPAAQFPNLLEWVEQARSVDPVEAFDFGLGVVLTGLTARLG